MPPLGRGPRQDPVGCPESARTASFLLHGARAMHERRNCTSLARVAMVHKAPLKIYARGVVSYFYFSRAPRARARAENQANQQCHFKSSRCRIDPLGTDSCRGTVPLETPMSNAYMRPQETTREIDDTGHLLLGALYTIAALT
jgi:hypothetical protein